VTRAEFTCRLVALALTAGAAALSAHGEQTRRAPSTPSDLERGESDGIAVTSRGRLFLAPRIAPWGKALPDAFPSQVFAASANGSGDVFLGTGPDGLLVKVARDGTQSIFFRVDEPLLTAVTALPTGEILVASAPGGKIYKVRPDGKGSVWCQTQERYVWALLGAGEGAVFAATGDRGRLLKIDRNGNSSVLFDADESHLVSLAPAPDGGVWAGGGGRGLLYRIDAEGHGRVAYDDDLPEAKALLPTPSGDLMVAFDAPPVSEKRPPALRLRVAGGTSGASEAMGDLDTRQQPAIQGVIEGLPSEAAEESLPLRGKIVRVSADGAAEELWRSRTEAPFALALDERSRALFATGEPAKIWRVEAPGEIALLATLKEAQTTAFARAARGLIAATSNPASVYALGSDSGESGTFLAPPVDAESVARWGTISWHEAGAGGRVELFTRTGNSEAPDGTWSAWSAARVDASGSPVTNPDGRFLQWRAKIGGGRDAGPSVASVAATYATKNRAPSIRDLRVEPASGAIAAKATIRWSAADPDGDGVSVDAQARPAGTSAWRSAVRTDPAPSKTSDPTLGNDGSAKDGKATWDTSSWDEGVYELRAVASDQLSNPPSEGLEATAELSVSVMLDRTPPTIDAKRRGNVIEVLVADALSGVARLEVVADGKVAFSPRPADGVCDNVRETFQIPAAQIGPGGSWSLRATDAAGNAFEAPVPGP
jgi:hypothetical protein